MLEPKDRSSGRPRSSRPTSRPASARGRTDANPRQSGGRVRGVLFDMDGTIVDVPYDWPHIKAELESGDIPILSYLSKLEEPKKSAKWAVLRSYEEDATRRAVLKRGVRGFLRFLAGRKVRTALITNNSMKNTEVLLRRYKLTFDLVMTREAGLWKPSGAPLIAAMKTLRLGPRDCCGVGDSHFDVRAAREARIGRIFILGRDRARFSGADADVEIVSSYTVLRKRIEPLL